MGAQSVAMDVAGAEIRANSTYAAARAKYERNDLDGGAACLSYVAYYACVAEFRRCELGDEQPYCQFVCEEKERRCGGDPSLCPSAPSKCSGAPSARLAAGVLVAAAALLLSPLFLLL